MRILEELQFPPIFMIPLEQYEHIDGCSLSGDYGISSVKYPVFAIRKGLRGRVKENVIYHEIFHLIFPHWKHWRVECAAERMARGGGRGYFSVKYGHTVDDVPPRARLLATARRAAKHMKR
jgi:hypothetical protein